MFDGTKLIHFHICHYLRSKTVSACFESLKAFQVIMIKHRRFRLRKCYFRVLAVDGLSNHPDFVGIIPILLENPDQYAIGIGKIPISTRVVLFFCLILIKENEMQNT